MPWAVETVPQLPGLLGLVVEELHRMTRSAAARIEIDERTGRRIRRVWSHTIESFVRPICHGCSPDGAVWIYDKRAIAGWEMAVAKNQRITFEMLEPAVRAIYELPTWDGRAGRT